MGLNLFIPMKKLLALASLVLAAAPAAFAAESSVIDDHALLPFGVSAHARVGMPRVELVEMLGAPSQKLSEHVWAYWDFRIAEGAGQHRGDALIVIFSEDRVNRLRFTSRRAVELALEKMRAASAPPTIAKN